MLNLKLLLLIPLFFLFLPAFCVPGGELSSFLPVYNLTLIIFFATLYLFNIKSNNSTIYGFYKWTSFKYFVYFVVWCIFVDIFLLICGQLSVSKTLYSIIVIVIGYYVFYSVYPAILLKFLNIKKIYKIIVLAIWLILLWGIISYLGMILHITPIEAIESFICNKHSLLLGHIEHLKLRNKSVFTEAGFYGYFLNTNLWFVYNIAGVKYRIFKNKYFNKIIKYTIVPLFIINILTTLSPITIIIFLIITTIYLLQQKSLFKRSFVIFIIAFTFLICSLPSIQETKPISRIQNTVSSFKDFKKFAVAEASLYTRISSYINTFYVFVKYPITGVGSGILKYHMVEQFKNSPVPLSAENVKKTKLTRQGGAVGFNLAILYTILAETGIVGFILLYTYFIKTICSLNKVKKFFYGKDLEFINSIIPTMWSMIVLSIYESFLINSPYLFLIFIIANYICLKQQKIPMLLKKEKF